LTSSTPHYNDEISHEHDQNKKSLLFDGFFAGWTTLSSIGSAGLLAAWVAREKQSGLANPSLVVRGFLFGLEHIVGLRYVGR